MAIRYEDRTAVLDGECAVEEAGDLAEWLIADATRGVDMAACSGLHTAVLQTLMALRPPVVAMPADSQWNAWLGRLLPPLPAARAIQSRQQPTPARTSPRRSKKAQVQ